MRTFVLLCLLLIAVPVAAQTRDEAPPPPVRPEAGTSEMPLGQLRVVGTVHVGDVAPDFTTASTTGRDLTLSHLKGDWVLLVFSQEREDFSQLRDIARSLAETGTRVYGICKDKPQRLRSYAEAQGLGFDLLA